jgi:dTDP-4-amino-4,6-dideoxygalactose transaminase
LKPTSAEVFKNSKTFYTNTARVGLRLLLSSISTKRLRIGVQVYTCHTVFQAIKRAGHDIVFLDLTNDLTLDINHLNENKTKIDVLIITHTFGTAEKVKEIKEILKDIIIIEDCSHAFLTSYQGKSCGTYGDAAIFSFGLGKFPPIGSGGLCVINNPGKFPTIDSEYQVLHFSNNLSALKEYVKILVYSFMLKSPFYGAFTYKIGKKLDARMDFTNKYSFYESKGFRWSRKMFENNLTHFKTLLKKNQDNFLHINSLLLIKHGNKSAESNHYIYPLLIEHRDKLYTSLIYNNIEAGRHFYKSIEWAKEFGYTIGMCPNSEQIIQRIITLPIHAGINKRALNKIAKIVNGENVKK